MSSEEEDGEHSSGGSGGGYEVRWFVAGEESLRERELLCSVCTGVFRDPVILVGSSQSCHHTFCRLCLDSWLLRANSCPLCRSSDVNYHTDKAAMRRINGLALRCNDCHSTAKFDSSEASAFWALHFQDTCLGIPVNSEDEEHSHHDGTSSEVELVASETEEVGLKDRITRLNKELNAAKLQLQKIEASKKQERILLNDVIAKQAQLWEHQKNVLLCRHQFEMQALLLEVSSLRKTVYESGNSAGPSSGASDAIRSGVDRLQQLLKGQQQKSPSKNVTSESSNAVFSASKLGRLSSRLDKLREQLVDRGHSTSVGHGDEEDMESRILDLMHWRDQIGVLFSSAETSTPPRSRH